MVKFSQRLPASGSSTNSTVMCLGFPFVFFLFFGSLKSALSLKKKTKSGKTEIEKEYRESSRSKITLCAVYNSRQEQFPPDVIYLKLSDTNSACHMGYCYVASAESLRRVSCRNKRSIHSCRTPKAGK